MKSRPHDPLFEIAAYDSAYYAKHRKYYDKALSNVTDFFLNTLGAVSICDIGCGTGAFIALAQQRGIPVIGIDISPEGGADLEPGTFLPHDLTVPIDPAGRQYDVVVSLETWEHIQRPFEDIFLANLFCWRPRWLVVSCAMPGQIGTHHYHGHTLDESTTLLLAAGGGTMRSTRA
jgi:cyclopropane fatty-acyl-phospholipid synthase-like methyltransferase